MSAVSVSERILLTGNRRFGLSSVGFETPVLRHRNPGLLFYDPDLNPLTKEEQPMSAKFGEVRKSSGLDLNAKPFPALIVPFGGSNIIKIFGAAGLSPFDDNRILVIKELSGDAMIMDKYLENSVPIAMAGIGGDQGAVYATMLKLALEIKLQLVGSPRFFQITGKALGGQAGTTVRVAKTQKSKAD